MQNVYNGITASDNLGKAIHTEWELFDIQVGVPCFLSSVPMKSDIVVVFCYIRAEGK